MQVTYSAPNRSHHYRYAAALARAGCLHRFVTGFPRISPHAIPPEVEKAKLRRADHLQLIYLASMKLKAPTPVSDELAYLSKIWMDHLAEKPALASDLFLFYSGSGLHTTRRLRATSTVCVVEAVNSHVLVQQRLLHDEHKRFGLPFHPFHQREVLRRVKEYSLADAILCPSQFVKDSFVAEGILSERVFIVPFGTSPPPSRTPAAPQGDATYRVLFVGQVNIRKGLRYLIEAFQRLRHPRKELLIVGPQTRSTGIEGMSLPANIRFTGVLKGEDLARAYQSASVFVLPSIEEGQALVLGEALAYGLPIITTINSGGSGLFQDQREGFLVPIRSSSDLAEKLQQLADDPDLRQRMSHAAQIRSQSLHGWETTDKLLIQTLKLIKKDFQ